MSNENTVGQPSSSSIRRPLVTPQIKLDGVDPVQGPKGTQAGLLEAKAIAPAATAEAVEKSPSFAAFVANAEITAPCSGCANCCNKQAA